LYASANGRAIEGLAMVYGATGDSKALALARRAAGWVLAHRSLGDGGFAHGAQADAGPYLADNLAMARALLELHRATGARVWLERARATADFILAHFWREPAGFNGSVAAAGPLQPVPNIDENISATRFFNLLNHYTGDTVYRDAAQHGMRYLAAPAVATERLLESGILLADGELAAPPVHVTVVGGHDDPVAQKLYLAALTTPGWYKRVEWWDPGQGALTHSDVQYPDLGLPAGYYCAQRRCSMPQFSAADLRTLVARRRDQG
ncbi:MAG: hypothetical protein L0H19_05495, partial [Salinisphaera sp.]|nr:hypothetical protein [Salinisphaera sp.]